LGLRVLRNKAEFMVELTIENAVERDVQALAAEDLVPHLKTGLQAYTCTKPLYSCKEKMIKVEVVTASTGFPERSVAIKRNHCRFETINDILREAVLQRKAENSHSCRLLDISCQQSNEELFEIGLVMECLDRDLLADIEERATLQVPYTETELLCVLGDIADALVFAKLQGVAHRDIKPANIFQNQSEWKVGDFGAACAAQQPGQIANGTREYISPEVRLRMLGEEVEVDWYQNDVFSLGVTMLHMTKLALPNQFEGWRSAEELESAVNQDMQDLHYSNSFLNILRSMLNFDPSLRPLIEEVRSEVLSASSHLNNKCCEQIGPHCSMATAPINTDSPDVDIKSLLQLANHQLYHHQLVEAERTLLHLLSLRNSQTLQPSDSLQITCALAWLYGLCERQSESKALLEDLLRDEIRKKAPATQELIEVQIMLAQIYLTERRFDEADKLLRDSLDKQLQFGTETVNTALILGTLAKIYFAEMRLKDAEDLLQQSLELSRKVGCKVLEVQNFGLIGLLRLHEGRYSEAEAAFLSCVEVSVQFYGDEHIRLTDVYSPLAATYIMQNRPAEAEVLIQLTIDLQKHWLGDTCPSLVFSYLVLSEACRYQDRPKEADQWQQTSLDLLVKHSGRDESGSWMHRFHHIRSAAESGKWGELESWILEALDKRSSLQNSIPLEKAVYSQQLGSLYLMQGKLKEAEDWHEKCLSSLSNSLPEEHPLPLNVNISLALTYLSEGKMAEAESLLGQVSTLRGKAEDSEPGMECCVRMMSDFLSGKTEAFEEGLGKSVAVFRRLLGATHPCTIMLEALASLPPE